MSSNPLVLRADGTWSGFEPPTEPPEFNEPNFQSTIVLNEDWSTGFDATRWFKENSTYGDDGNRIQRYRSENVNVRAATTGGTGDSCYFTSKEEFYIDRDYTAGMVGTRDLGVYYPRYGRYEAMMRIPHGHGIWPAFWLRHRNGSSVCEPDVMEYFIAEQPGKVGPQLHRTNNSGTYQNNVMPWTDSEGRDRFRVYENPVPEGQQRWVTIAMDIIPWTTGDAQTGTYGDPDTANTNVLYRMWHDGAITYEWVDDQSTNWTERYSDEAFDICLQGAQIGGTYVGHPQDPTGYSRWLNGGSCVIGGTAPDACTITRDGLTNRACDFPSDLEFEINHVRVWKYEGAPAWQLSAG